jgi:hypothetical protein
VSWMTSARKALRLSVLEATMKERARLRGTTVSLDMQDIHTCVVCGKRLAPGRKHVDTCGERCFKKLLVAQRGEPKEIK